MQWGGHGSAWALCLPPTTYSDPTFQGLCGWAVGTQMLCQVTNAGETEAAAKAGAGDLLSCRMYTAGLPIPPLPRAVQGSAQRGIYQAGVTLWFPTGSLPSTASIGLSCQRAGAERTWLITAATAWHTLSDSTKYGKALFSFVPGPVPPQKAPPQVTWWWASPGRPQVLTGPRDCAACAKARSRARLARAWGWGGALRGPGPSAIPQWGRGRLVRP